MPKTLTGGLSLALLLLAGPALAVMPVTPPKVPSAFQGFWTGQGKSCAPGADPSQIRLGPHSMWMWGNDDQVLAGTPHGPREVVLKVQVLSGDVYSDMTFKFRLSADGKILTEVGQRANIVRKRCPK